MRADWLADMYSTYRRHFNVWSELDVAVGMLSLVVKMTTTIEMTVHDGNYGDDDDDNNDSNNNNNNNNNNSVVSFTFC